MFIDSEPILTSRTECLKEGMVQLSIQWVSEAVFQNSRLDKITESSVLTIIVLICTCLRHAEEQGRYVPCVLLASHCKD